MSQAAEKGSELPAERAFVVQFRQETDLEKGVIEGRVEHLVSGESAHFGSLEELVQFIGKVLRDDARRAAKKTSMAHKANFIPLAILAKKEKKP